MVEEQKITRTETARTTTETELLPPGAAEYALQGTRHEPKANLLSSVLAIIGFIILIAIVLWGLYHLATLSGPWLSSLFNTSLFNKSASSAIEVTAPAHATSTTPLQPTPAAQNIHTTPEKLLGPADLSVTIVSLAIDQSGEGIAEFDIRNGGGGSSGAYYFEAQLPTPNGYYYLSPLQNPLGPGDHVLNTLRFSEAIPGIVSVSVDPANAIRESDESNNYVSQQITMPYYYNYVAPSPYGNQPYQQPYQSYQYSPYVY